MKRTDIADLVQNACCLAEQNLNVRTVFPYDIGQIASRVIKPVAVKIHLIREQFAVQRAEGSERVSRKQDAIREIETDHRLRPVNHWRENKGDGMSAEAKRIAFLDFHAGMRVDSEAELAHHQKSFFIADDRNLRIAQKHFLDTSRVIRLQMVDDQIIQRTSMQHIF